MPAIQKARLAEALATATETEQTKAAYRAETQRQLADRYAQVSTKRIQLSVDNSKATQREKQRQLSSPVDSALQQLMVVVPDATQVTAKVAIANQDIGFVNASQAAEIKLDTFSVTKYGTVKATVDNVSADAVTDEKRGAFTRPS